jgi:ABC-type bacteriocin/lantibiotic exporter with double-glycine peptidase domain
VSRSPGPGQPDQGKLAARIVLDQVDKVYPGGAKGIDGLSLDIADGEFMVLVGPSGCGDPASGLSIGHPGAPVPD